MNLKKFTKELFACSKPAGSLGKKYLLQVEDVMKKGAGKSYSSYQ